MSRTRLFLGTLLAGTIVAAAGCGPSLSKFKGVVQVDGTPTEGVTVSFISEDGNRTYTGLTDSTGTFTLSGLDGKPGVPAGTYKVTVVKREAMMAGGENAGPGSAEYMKQMEKMGKEAGKAGRPNMMMPGMNKGAGASKVSYNKSELPAMYGSATTTPITVTVPPPTDPVVIELKSKP